jgi:uncharacterized protein YjdB
VTVGPPPIVSVTIAPQSSTVTAGQVVQLTATVTDAIGNSVTSSTVAWTTDDAQIANPASTGNLTADVSTSNTGTATITASVAGVQGTATITVDPGAVSTITVTGPSKNLKPGFTTQLTATAQDTQGNVVPNQSFFWTTSNPLVASVSSSGAVTGIHNGNVTITAYSTLIAGKSGWFSMNVK